jgi:hypothetical protein
VAVKVPLVEAAGILREPGTVSTVELLDKVTDAPPAGAAPDSVTVQLEIEPVPKFRVLQVKEVMTTGPIENTTLAVVPLYVAVTVADWDAVTLLAVAVKVPEAAPAAIVTDAGTLKAARLLESVIEAPPAGAADDRVIVQDDVPAPVKLIGAQPNELMTIGANDTEVLWELEL